jgi:drug/metabolite transporter (DMT)-like permease
MLPGWQAVNRAVHGSAAYGCGDATEPPQGRLPMSAAPPSSPQHDDERLRGIRLRIASISCFATMAALAKLAGNGGASTLEILFFRNAFALPVIIGVLLAGPGLRSVHTSRPGAHLGRSLIGLTSMLLTFQALSMLPLADATSIGFSTPLFATILSAMLLAEPVHRHRWTAIAIGMVGVLIIMRPGGQHASLAGMGVALAGAVASAIATVTIRSLGASERPTTTVFWFTVAGTLAMSLAMPFAAQAHDPLTWCALVGIGLAGGAAQVLMTTSLRYAPVSVVAPFDYLSLPWSILYGFVLFSAAPSATTLVGAALIVASGLYTIHRERQLRREAIAAAATSIQA